MFKNKASNGRNNICGRNVARMRKDLHLSQRELAEQLQIHGMDVDKNAIQRLECGKRYVTDIEIVALAKTLNCTYEYLLAPFSIIDE